MPHMTRKKWPRLYGFEVNGPGPSYVTAVEKGGAADQAGVIAGDHILQIDNQDVRNLPSHMVKLIGRQNPNPPPTLSVVSHLHQVHLTRDKVKGFGFSIRDDHPLLIGKVELSSPASKAGLLQGDIILGINGQPVQTVETVGNLIDGKSSHLLLLFIPIGRNLQPGQSPLKSDVRGHRARQLYKKLNEVLGVDFEKKMAVVGILKQYAETRNLVMLCSALLTVLKSHKHRQLLADFRLFIPVRYRSEFDRIVEDYCAREQTSHVTRQSPIPEGPITKIFRLPRSADGYGFVLKGAQPVFLESIDVGKSADRAGLCAGDSIITVNGVDVRQHSHQSVVDRLQRSKGLVVLEILRYTNKDSGTQTDSDVSSLSSSMSTSWIEGLQHSVDEEGRTFKRKIEFLLTPRERLELKGAVVQYQQYRDVSRLYESLYRILDTPSKESLWLYIYQLLPTAHKEYCMSRRSSTHTSTQGIAKHNQHTPSVSFTKEKETQASGSPRSKLMMGTRSLIEQHQVTLTSQMASTLTLRERSQMKKAMKHYSENRKLHRLIEELDDLFNTEEKQRLWIGILPELESDHQTIIKHKYPVLFKQENPGLHISDSAPIERKERVRLSLPQEAFIGSPQHAIKTEEFNIIGEAADSLKHSSQSQSEQSTSINEKPVTERSKHLYQKNLHQNNNRATYHVTVPFGKIHLNNDDQPPDLGENQKEISSIGTSQIDPDLIKELQKTRKALAETKHVIIHAGSAQKHTGLSGELTLPSKEGNNKRYITFVPVGYPGLENQPYKAVEMDSPNLERIRKFGPSMLEAHAASKSPAKSSQFLPPQNGYHWKHDSDSSEVSPDKNSETFSLKKESHGTNKTPSVKSLGSNSVNGQAMQVLKQLDDVMATEILKSNTEGRLLGLNNPSSAPSPPPPPPPPQPPAAPPINNMSTSQSMNVKRINWEKLTVDNIEETVWGQIGDTEYLDDVIQYLELEEQFSTTPNKIGATVVQRKEVDLILSPKKAYNISILLGHLKMSVDDMRRAVYSMDETVLTGELITQLLAYSPSQQEISSYSKLVVDDTILSPPDRFAYTMSQIPLYEGRLMAMLFKATFGEKVAEIKGGLTSIIQASKELRSSKKLSKILELILALGNHLNKGNSRVGEASAFRIAYLSQLDVTKTQDNKHTFLHVLSDAVRKKYPDSLTVGEELTSVPTAAKISLSTLSQELESLQNSVEEVTGTLKEFGTRSVNSNDRFYQVISPFTLDAIKKLGNLSSFQKNAEDHFKAVVCYFGEDPRKIQTTELFTIFSEFISKFQIAHQQNLKSPLQGH